MFKKLITYLKEQFKRSKQTPISITPEELALLLNELDVKQPSNSKIIDTENTKSSL